jgi:Skp family chaperone for outer membrane proteins
LYGWSAGVRVENQFKNLKWNLPGRRLNLACSNQKLEQKSEKLHHQMVEKDETHARELQEMQAEQSRLEQDFNAQVSQYAELEQSLNFENHEIIDY